MPIRNDRARWGAVSITLHWLTLLLVLALAVLGLTMVGMATSPDKIQVYSLHKSLGLTVLGLTTLRLLWRFFSPVPAQVAGTPRWQHAIARLSHAALYLLLLLVPFSGWWFNSTAGFPLRWFGLVALPPLGEFDKALKASAKETHETLFWMLVAMIAIHAGAALWHHYRLRDATLQRMLPGYRPDQQEAP